jgi:uncharacterized UPF0160 family protein
MTEQYKMGWTDPRIMSMVELFADYVATKAQVDKPWVGLTDEEILEAAGIDGADTWIFNTAYAIEAKLKEKNT